LHDMIPYDTIRKKSLTWTQKLSDPFNLAHVARKIWKKKKLKQTNACDHLVQYSLKIHEGSSEGIRMILWRKGFVKEMSFSLE